MLTLGFLLTALAAAFVILDKNARTRREAEEYSALLALLVFFKGGLAAARRTPSELFAGFHEREDSAALPWLAHLFESGSGASDGSGTCADFNDVGERVALFMRERGILTAETQLSAEDKERVASLFYDFGRPAADEEINRLDGEIAHFSEREREVRERCDKSVKVSWLLFVTVCAGALLIIL